MGRQVRGNWLISSESVENYLKAIYELSETQAPVTTGAIADRLGVAAPSVSAMLKRLSEQRTPLVDYTPHRGVELAPRGRARALRIVRRHRLVETFLCKVLGYAWDEVHEEAERLEHHISDLMEARIAEHLGHPEVDPHGAPIPTPDGDVPPSGAVPLSDVAEGIAAQVRRIRHDDGELLRYLTTLGIEPEAEIVVRSRAPFDGPVVVAVGEGGGTVEHAVGRQITDAVLVTPRRVGGSP